MRRSANAVTMLAHRLRRCANIVSTLAEHLVLAGLLLLGFVYSYSPWIWLS